MAPGCPLTLKWDTPRYPCEGCKFKSCSWHGGIKMIKLTVELPNLDIADSLIDWLSREELLSFVKDLDRLVCECEFTESLRDYFVKEVEKDEEEHK